MLIWLLLIFLILLVIITANTANSDSIIICLLLAFPLEEVGVSRLLEIPEAESQKAGTSYCVYDMS